jgi:CHAT domain-containing protein
MSPRLGLALITIVAALAAGARPTAQQPQVFTAPELTQSPYSLRRGQLADADLVKKHEALAAVAEKTGDPARAARHYAVACSLGARLARDVAMNAPPCGRARVLADKHDVRDAKIQLQLAIGTVRAWSFNFAGALDALNEGIALGKGLDPDHPDSAPLIGVHQILGSTLIELGQFDAAGKELTFARDHCRASGAAVCAAYADIWLCRLHTMLGDFGEARAACDVAQAEAAVDNDPMVRANLGWMRGTLEAALGRPAASLAALQDAWQAVGTYDAGFILRPIIAQLIVDALVRLGRVNEADTWQRDLDNGLADRSIPFFLGPQIAMRRGQIAAVRGRLDDAEAAFTIGSRSLIHEMSIRGHVAVARMNRYQGRFDAARVSLERAIEKIETGRTNVGGSALRASYLTMHASAYRELVGVRWDAEGATAAPAILELAEAGRARALVDTLASAQVAGAQAPTLTAAEVQARLAADEVLVEYVSSDERLIAITVTRDRIAVTPLERAGNEEDLTRRVSFFSTLAQESDEAALAPAAKRLYLDLLAPALAGVPDTARTLIIGADGPLHGLPFDALGDTTRVIDRWNVVMVPSASALAGRVRQITPRYPTLPALVVTASTSETGLAPLPAAPAEAAAIRGRISGNITVLSGNDATKARLDASQLDRFAVLHFASHALVDEERPLRSALVLADGGRWTAEEIYRSKLRAGLVVLSACSTAAGAPTPGEGVMSLSRAFLQAGAAATVATLWDVPDAPAPTFADVLYRELTQGRPLGAAAAEARRELRRLGAPPRAWAAYVLTGNPGAVVGVTARTPARRVAAALFASIALALMIVAAAVRATRLQWRLNPIRLAAASILFAATAMTLQQWPIRDSLVAGASLASRGAEDASIAPLIASNTITWPAVTRADEHVVELFDDAGMPAGPERITTSPFTLPSTPQAAWVRVSARRAGQDVAHSPLMRVAR